MTNIKGYVPKVLLGLDFFFSMVLFRDPNVTISSETGLAMQRAKPPKWAKALCWTLDKIQKDHCANAIKGDISRAQNAINYLQTKQS